MKLRFICAFLPDCILSFKRGCLAVLLSLVTCMVCAQSDYPGLYHTSYVNRHRLLDSLVEPSARKLGADGYLRQMTFLQEQARNKKDRELQLALDQHIYYFNEGDKQLTADEKIIRLKAMLQKIDREAYPEYASWCLYEMGNNYFGKRHEYNRAFDYYAQAIRLITELSSKNFPDKKGIVVDIANKYYRLGAYDQAKELLQMADTIQHNWESRRLADLNAKNTLGLIFRTNGNFDSAVYFFNAARQLAQQRNDSTWMAITSGNIGICHYLAKNYAAAIPLLYNDIKYSFSPGRHAVDNGMNSLLILADIHIKMDSMERLGKDVALARQYIDSCVDKVKPASMLYPVLGKYLFRLGKFRESAIAYDSANIYKDSLARRDNVYQLARMEHLREVEKYNDEIQKINVEKRMTVLTRNALLAVFVLLTIITLLVIGRQRIRHRMKNNALTAKNALAELQLRDATEKLEHYTLHLQEKNELIERAGEEIEKLQSTIDNQQYFQTNNEVLQKLYSSTILTDEEWNEFKALFEQVHKGYLQWLKDRIPDLTPSDTRFLVLHKLKLSNKEMAGILGIQPDSIRSYKHRLKKRLDLTDDTGLKQLLGELFDKAPGAD